MNFKFDIKKYGLVFMVLGYSLASNNVSGAAETKDHTPIWEAADQYINIVQKDDYLGEKTSLNQHPIELSSEDISKVLGRISVTKDKTLLSKSRTIPLFQAAVAEHLSQHLSRALSLSDTKEDVTFAVMTLQSQGFGKVKTSVSGRVFYDDNKLNIIVGDLFAPTVPENYNSPSVGLTTIDRRLHPHRPGLRSFARQHPHQFIPAQGISLHQVKNEQRSDWLLLDIAEREADSNALNATVKKSADLNIEQRLLQLEGLYIKKRISEDEYRQQRKRILSEI